MRVGMKVERSRSACRRACLRALRQATASLVLLALPLLVSACGGGAADGPDVDLVVVGTDRLTFEPDRLRMAAGTASVALVCERGAPHNLVIEETGEEVVACVPGATAVGELTLAAGTYVYFCSVPGHEITMRGVLEVR
jgi:plastocyanin